MKGKRLKNAIAVSAMSLGLLVSLVVTGCEEPCCPKITVAKVIDPWVCPAHCTDGGKTGIIYRVEFWRGNELCKPPPDFKISIKNVTDGVDLPQLQWGNPQTGVCEGKADITLTKDTEYELTATAGRQACGEASAKLKVNVVDQGDFHELCFWGKLDWPNCEHRGYVPFGPGVFIDHVENLSDFKIRVTKDVKTEFLQPYGVGSLRGLHASGDWAIGLTTEHDCAIYASLPADKQKLCVKVYLQCRCP